MITNVKMFQCKFLSIFIVSFFLGISTPAKLKCRKNEVLNDNPSPCGDRHCPVNRESIQRPCTVHPISQVKLAPRCECRFNYSRARNGKCIPTNKCPPIPCGVNEVFDTCPPYCPTDDCSQATSSGKCPTIGRIGIVVQCRPRCRCIENFWRKNNVCVPYEQCEHSDIPVCNTTLTEI